MKTIYLLFAFLFTGILQAQDLEGAWRLTSENGQDIKDQETIKIYQDGYFAFGSKETDTNKFLKAGGGEYSVAASGSRGYIEAFDFHTEKAELIGTEKNFQIEIEGNELRLSSEGNKKQVWQKISDREDELSGNWVITGRERNGEMNTMTPGARRTVKILGGGRFQWVAFNSETKEFSGTGGGTYTAQNGRYTENIEFFSRDDSRVGASLGFNYEVKDGQWHHKGKSSKGDPIYEIWSAYKEAYGNKK